MGVIVNQNISYGSGKGGGDSSVTMHWAEYQALSEEEKRSGNYYIDDVDTVSEKTTSVTIKDSHGYDITIKRSWNIVNIIIPNNRYAFNANTSNLVFTIPEEYRPSQNIFTSWRSNTVNTASASFEIATNGEAVENGFMLNGVLDMCGLNIVYII